MVNFNPPSYWINVWESFVDDEDYTPHDCPIAMPIILPSTNVARCGLDPSGKFVLFPFFIMNGSGYEDAVVDVAWLPVPTILDKAFFKRVSMLIAYIPPVYNWDWDSFRMSIITPNIAHIQLVNQLTDETTSFLEKPLFSCFLEDWKGHDEDDYGGEHFFANAIDFDQV